MSGGVDFDEATHTYRLDGVPVEHVTGVLAAEGLVDLAAIPEATLEWKASVGRAAHRATQLDDLGRLDESSVDDIVRPYLVGYRKWKATVRPVFNREFIERPMIHSVWRYGTTPDRGSVQIGGRWGVLEVKCTTTIHPAVGLQLAAQALCVRECAMGPIMPRARWVLQLDPSKAPAYRLRECTDPGDESVWLAALAIHRWKANRAAGAYRK